MMASVDEQARVGLLKILFGKSANLVKFARRRANGQDKEKERRTFRQFHRCASNYSSLGAATQNRASYVGCYKVMAIQPDSVAGIKTRNRRCGRWFRTRGRGGEICARRRDCRRRGCCRRRVCYFACGRNEGGHSFPCRN